MLTVLCAMAQTVPAPTTAARREALRAVIARVARKVATPQHRARVYAASVQRLRDVAKALESKGR